MLSTKVKFQYYIDWFFFGWASIVDQVPVGHEATNKKEKMEKRKQKAKQKIDFKFFKSGFKIEFQICKSILKPDFTIWKSILFFHFL